MEVKKYQAEDKARWNDFLSSAKNSHFLFHRDYMEYHSDRFKDHSLMFFNNESLLAILPANLKDGSLYSHQGLTYGGFICSNKMTASTMLDCFSALKNYCKSESIKEIFYKALPYIYHLIPAQEDLYALFRNNAELYRADVSATIDLSTKAPIRNSRLRSIKKAKELNAQIEEASDYQAFFELVAKRLDEKYQVKPTHTYQEMELLASRFPENIKLDLLKINGELLAGAICYLSKSVCHAQYIFASDKGRELSMPDLLIDYLANEKYKDYKYFDFGNSNEDGGKYLNEALMSFKESFGARATIQEFYKISI